MQAARTTNDRWPRGACRPATGVHGRYLLSFQPFDQIDWSARL